MDSETVFGKLGKWVNEPLEKLSSDLQDIASAYIPEWQTLTPKARTDSAVEVDRQRGIKSKLRYDEAVRQQKAAQQDEAEDQYWFDLFALIADKEQEITDWELMRPVSISEAQIKGDKLASLRAELESLKNQSNAPYPAPFTATAQAPVKPVSRAAAQDAAILAVIKNLGFDPLALPTVAKGKAGVKSEVRGALVGVDPLFPTEGKRFEKAWERLRQFGDIADQG